MRRARKRWALACARALALAMSLAGSARAIVLSEDPLEGDSIDVGGAIRSYNFVMEGGPLTAPAAPPDANPAAVALIAARPTFDTRQGSLRLVVHDEMLSTTSTLPTDVVGSALSIGQGRRAPVWLPLQWTAVDRPSYQLRNRVDWAYARFTQGSISLTLGRQPVTVGRGQIWTPEDLLGPFSPLQLNTEFKPGVDALRLDWTPSETTSLLVIGSLGKMNPSNDFQIGADGSAVLTRAEVAFANARLGVLAGMVRGDAVGGLDVFVDLGGGVDLHAEGTVTYVPDAERRRYGRTAFNRALIGSTSELAPHLNVTAEAYFNGSGAPRPADYVAELASPRFEVGEVYNVGRLYAGLLADWEIHPSLHGVVSVLSNLEDPSAMVAPELDYNLATNTLLVAGAFVPIGSSPRYSEPEMIAKSEFGLYPRLYHLDVKLYF